MQIQKVAALMRMQSIAVKITSALLYASNSLLHLQHHANIRKR